ncbi:MAG: hypothetical protein DMF74_04565 [Acidobacteria bacterium]|nr:MAG: hypothetical protein DMF74_04565 [Acidobacteriota bacterium]
MARAVTRKARRIKLLEKSAIRAHLQRFCSKSSLDSVNRLDATDALTFQNIQKESALGRVFKKDISFKLPFRASLVWIVGIHKVSVRCVSSPCARRQPELALGAKVLLGLVPSPVQQAK